MNKKIVIAASASTLIIGILFFLIYNNRIAISFRFGHNAAENALLVRSEKKPIAVWYWINGTMKNDQRELLWSTSMVFNATNAINSWLAILDQEEAVAQPATIQDVSFSGDDQELIISFDRAPFGHDDAMYDKLMIIESLLKTLRGCEFAAQRVRFLVHHQPLSDAHLDFTKPWPMTGFVEMQTYPEVDAQCFACVQHDARTPFTIILDPAGDARIAGRVIGDSYERSLTFQCLDLVRDYLESHIRTVRVLLTRLPGETLEPLQNVAFANRLKADLYVSVHMYPAQNKVTDLNVYYDVSKPGIAECSAERQLDLKPYNDGSERFQKASYCVAAFFERFITDTFRHDQVKIHRPLGVPCKPLIGVMAPAVALEIGLHDKNDVAMNAEYIGRSIENLIKTFKMY